MSARKPKLYLELSTQLVGMSKPLTVLPPNEPISPGADREMVGAGVMGGGSAASLTPQPGDAPPMPRPNPQSKSMSGPSGKTATKETQTPTAPESYEDRPPIHATADLVACGERVVSAREITTKNGRTCVLTTESGTDYWGSELLLKQLEKSPDILPDVVVEAVSANGRKYRTFLTAKKAPGRRFGRSALSGE